MSDCRYVLRDNFAKLQHERRRGGGVEKMVHFAFNTNRSDRSKSLSALDTVQFSQVVVRKGGCQDGAVT